MFQNESEIYLRELQSTPAYPTAAMQSQVSGAVHTPPFMQSGLHIARMIQIIKQYYNHY